MVPQNQETIDAEVKLILVLLLLTLLGGLLYMFYYLEEKRGVSLSPPALTEEGQGAFSLRDDEVLSCTRDIECPVEKTCDIRTHRCT